MNLDPLAELRQAVWNDPTLAAALWEQADSPAFLDYLMARAAERGMPCHRMALEAALLADAEQRARRWRP